MKLLPVRSSFVACCLAVVGMFAGSPALAQTPIGASPVASNVLTSVAYDDKHHVYLHVYELANDVYARFLDANGTVLGAAFPVAGHKLTFSGYPFVAYSRNDAGVDEFLLIYYSDANGTGKANIFAQRIAYTGGGPSGGGVVGGFITPSNSAAPIQKPTAVVYNPLMHRFLMAWEEGGGAEISQVGADGSVVGTPFNASAGRPGVYGGGTVAFDWNRNRYIVAFFGGSTPSDLGTYACLLDGNTATPITGLMTVALGFTDELTSTYLPEADGFVIAWTLVTRKYDVMARFVPSTYSAGELPSPSYGAMVSPTINAGASSVDYDYVSRDVLMSAMRDPRFIGGAVMNGAGTLITGSFTMSTTNPINGSFYPKTVAAENGVFAVSYDTDYTTSWLERFQMTPANTPGPHCCTGGGGPPPPPSGGVNVQIDLPTVNQTLSEPFAVTGWAIDTRATSGPGVDFLHVWAEPHNGGANVFVGQIATGGARPDVAQAFGGNFGNAGYGVLMSNVPPGVYTLVAFPHSSVTGAFDYDKVKTVDVTILGGALTQVDAPQWAQSFGAGGLGMSVSGYAIDLTDPIGTGIDAVNIYAISASTSQPTFLGTAAYGNGLTRPDVAALFGDPRFLQSGFVLTNPVALPPDTYYIAVFSHSAGAQWNLARIVGVFVN